MSAPEIEFHVTGPDARRLADEFAELMAAELGTRPRPSSEGDSRPSEPVRCRGADPVAVAALILAVPGAALAAADLAQRLELKQKLDRLLAWARDKLADDSQNRIEVVVPQGKTLELDRADSAEMIEIATEVTVRVTRRWEKR